jgi:hypothetical protein
MNEELLELEVGDVLVDTGEVVISVEGELDSTEPVHIGAETDEAEVIPVNFNGGPTLTDHMDRSALDNVPPANIIIFAPRQLESINPATKPKTRLHSDAGVANRAELEFSTQEAA